jgi:hypothetical protein
MSYSIGLEIASIISIVLMMRIQKNFAAIANYVQKEYSSRKPNNPNIASFLSVADPWLIAKAKTLSATLVTHEVRAGNGSFKPKIPDICDKFGVATIRTNELLRNLQIKFIKEIKNKHCKIQTREYSRAYQISIIGNSLYQ